jgi:small subunit ribosomal protein S9
MTDDVTPDETPEETPAVAEDAPQADAAEATPVAETPAEPVAEEAPAEEAVAEEEPVAEDDADEEDDAPRVKPSIPGADLEVDIVFEGAGAQGDKPDEFGYYAEGDADGESSEGENADGDDAADEPIADVSIDLSAGARYAATGKRKSAIARVILSPGEGTYTVNGKGLDEYFPREALRRNIRQALEVVGQDKNLDVRVSIQGGGVSAQAGALRHGISRALLVAQPNLRGELKKRGFLTRDARVKERKKAGLKKARKRPQFSKR